MANTGDGLNVINALLPNPVNPFQDDGVSKEDKAMIDAMRNTAYVCGCRGEDVEFAVDKALKRMRRFDLLSSCEQS